MLAVLISAALSYGGNSNTSCLLQTRVPADNKPPHKAVQSVRAHPCVCECVCGPGCTSACSHLRRDNNRLMRHGGALYKPGSKHEEAPPTATDSGPPGAQEASEHVFTIDVLKHFGRRNTSTFPSALAHTCKLMLQQQEVNVRVCVT